VNFRLDLSGLSAFTGNVELWQLAAIATIGAGVGYLGGIFGKGGSAMATPLLAAIGREPVDELLLVAEEGSPMAALGCFERRAGEEEAVVEHGTGSYQLRMMSCQFVVGARQCIPI